MPPFTEGMNQATTLAELDQAIQEAKEDAQAKGVELDLSGGTRIEYENPEDDIGVYVYADGTIDARPYHSCDWA